MSPNGTTFDWKKELAFSQSSFAEGSMSIGRVVRIEVGLGDCLACEVVGLTSAYW